jgi:AmmeMemoRadiSam system protein B/AmmeMemoRadiSam system protein A
MKLSMLLIIGFAAAMVWTEVRAPAVAGTFYSRNPEQLRAEIEEMLDKAPEGGGTHAAVIVPHAGYVYSGQTAARGFAQLRGRKLDRIILLGPSHHSRFVGGALPDSSLNSFKTPLGEISLDREVLKTLAKDRFFKGPSRAHQPEHSLEVEIPFIQVVAPSARLVPVLVGPSTDRGTLQAMAKSLSQFLDEKTVVVASTDFSHHGSAFGWAPFLGSKTLADDLLGLARSTAACAAAGDASGFWRQVDVSGDTVCGMRPVVVLLELIENAFEGKGKTLEVTTSGHVSGHWDRVVSYVSIAFDGEWQGWKDGPQPQPLRKLDSKHGQALLELARATLRTHVSSDGSLAGWHASHPSDNRPKELAGAFVTLHNRGRRAKKEGRLRACMGVMEADKPVVETIVQAAVSAAHDPRFPRLEADELDELHLEISVLSASQRVSGYDEIDVGTHGVILSKNGRRAVFLPQVATEQGWDRDTMLSHLARKAGLSTDSWKHGARFEVFTAQVFAEEE